MIPEVTLGATQALLAGRESVVSYVSPSGEVWPLSGGLAPVLGAQEGVTGSDWKGLMAPSKIIEQAGAREDGATWRDTVHDPLEVDFTANMWGHTPESFRTIHRSWFDSWSDRDPGRLVWFTTTAGEWWLPVRLGKEITDQLSVAPGYAQSAKYAWVARTDGLPFWRSFDSADEVPITASSVHGFVRLINRGNLLSSPRFICQGPGTFTFTYGAQKVAFGPLKAGQTAVVTTQLAKRGVVELTTSENLYPLLKGRFTSLWQMPGVGLRPDYVAFGIQVDGATPGLTRAMAAVTPYRNWPE